MKNFAKTMLMVAAMVAIFVANASALNLEGKFALTTEYKCTDTGLRNTRWTAAENVNILLVEETDEYQLYLLGAYVTAEGDITGIGTVKVYNAEKTNKKGLQKQLVEILYTYSDIRYEDLVDSSSFVVVSSDQGNVKKMKVQTTHVTANQIYHKKSLDRNIAATCEVKKRTFFRTDNVQLTEEEVKADYALEQAIGAGAEIVLPKQ